jgi:hypothetical protein
LKVFAIERRRPPPRVQSSRSTHDTDVDVHCPCLEEFCYAPSGTTCETLGRSRKCVFEHDLLFRLQLGAAHEDQGFIRGALLRQGHHFLPMRGMRRGNSRVCRDALSGLPGSGVPTDNFALRAKPDFPSRINVIWVVQSPLAKIYRFRRRANQRHCFARPGPKEGRCATSPTRAGMRWTRRHDLTKRADADGEVVWS